ncbi:MAG: (2Fe-2S)-binding protein [Clostridium sp.]
MGLFSRGKKENIICKCKKVTKDEVIEAIKSGCTTFEKVAKKTGIGMGHCRGRKCKELVDELIFQNK